MNDILPAEERTAEEVDDLFSTLERDGIDIYEDVATAKAVRAALKIAEPKDAGDQNEPAAAKRPNSTSRRVCSAGPTIR